MKNKFATLLLSLAGMAAILSAQTSDHAPVPVQSTAKTHKVNSPELQLKHLSNKLALTADQQNQILPILTDRQQQRSAIEADTTLTRKDRNSRLLAVRNDAESKIRGVLTDTQRAAYDQMKQDQKQRARSKKLTTVSN